MKVLYGYGVYYLTETDPASRTKGAQFDRERSHEHGEALPPISSKQEESGLRRACFQCIYFIRMSREQIVAGR